ncbi:glycosyltransferase family 4 protein [Streptomyces albipurpureus]|uniref:D-inositol 3-phosphate glycosyltransferase n=1 Tax=Streptomyces albipurpureus TaxID=2897419 RepID=A0ABT0UYV7_9ACTN|nr:glycosyltransferase family 4 protein [Streptomyces sp. CWNU-1]MCM2393290.1 glycosyltransferase family 4 protein [Streptomyces sp. CWNU-1]
MKPDSTTPARETRGRVVMLVDNGVKADSRVQKAARSAAEAGWDVVLFGVSATPKIQSWKLGDAQVRLIPKPAHLEPRRHELRRPLLRRPLAYRSQQVAQYRVQAAKAWRSDLAFRQAAAKAAQAGHPGKSVSGSKGRLLLPRVSAKLVSKWVALRARETRNLNKRRKPLTAPLDRTTTALWTKLMGERSWRRLMPNLWDFELAFAKHIDDFEPDLIHAHDFKMLGVGARAAVRARAKGRSVKLVWDAHEFVPGLPEVHGRWVPGHAAWEKEHAVFADAAITVSPSLAQMLKDGHGLKELPSVVLNAPVMHPGEDELKGVPPVGNLRELCGLDADTPLLAYVGGISPVRGVETIIEALPSLPGVHVALVSVTPRKMKAIQSTQKIVDELGVGDRVHFLPFVPHWQVPDHLASADAAVSPLHHLMNHEVALSNKFFEYSQARLPLVVSDIRTMAEMVRSTGQGEVFKAQDVQDFVRATKAVLEDPERYRKAYDKPGLLDGWTWEAQAKIIDEIYTRLLPDRPPLRRQAPVKPAEPVESAQPVEPGQSESV